MSNYPIIDVLIVVDVEGALADQQNFGPKYVYLVDTTGYLSGLNTSTTTGEGSSELCTTCHADQVIHWNVASISADNSVSITGFSSNSNADHPMVPNICNPVLVEDSNEPYWSGLIASNAPQSASQSPSKNGYKDGYQYTVSLCFNGMKTLTFDPYIYVV